MLGGTAVLSAQAQGGSAGSGPLQAAEGGEPATGAWEKGSVIT